MPNKSVQEILNDAIDYAYLGRKTIPMSGLSYAVLDLATIAHGRNAAVQWDPQTNAGYRLRVALSSGDEDVVDTNFADACTGGGFTAQPTNAKVTASSSEAGDAGAVLTVYGINHATGLLEAIEITLNGDTGVDSTESLDYVMAAVLSAACTGDVTLAVKSGADILTISAGETSVGITAVDSDEQPGYDLPWQATASAALGATYKVGVLGTNGLGESLASIVSITNADGTNTIDATDIVRTATYLLHGAVPATKTITFARSKITVLTAAKRLTDGGVWERAFTPTHRYLHCLVTDQDGTVASAGASDVVLAEVEG